MTSKKATPVMDAVPDNRVKRLALGWPHARTSALRAAATRWRFFGPVFFKQPTFGNSTIIVFAGSFGAPTTRWMSESSSILNDRRRTLIVYVVNSPVCLGVERPMSGGVIDLRSSTVVSLGV